ncbi:CHAT domain-containing protein, partial [Okeania sp. SIO2G5]|uniref:CHAT domain-containing protein n=1 Tax=Okeania sp. SIO2G5 TaxID=2607796 RepID=UPI0013C2523B
AGARAAIASLWRVDDESTSDLMKTFYNQRQEGLTQAEALRSAQLAMIKSAPGGAVVERGHPYHWAPFILIGNGF